MHFRQLLMALMYGCIRRVWAVSASQSVAECTSTQSALHVTLRSLWLHRVVVAASALRDMERRPKWEGRHGGGPLGQLQSLGGHLLYSYFNWRKARRLHRLLLSCPALGAWCRAMLTQW